MSVSERSESLESFVTVDLGNTRAKLRAWPMPTAPAAATAPGGRTPDGRTVRAGVLPIACAVAPTDPAALKRALSGFAKALARSRVRRVGFCSVASEALTEMLRRGLREHFGWRLLDPLRSGLDLSAFEPSDAADIGRDRLFAARGAWELCGNAIVIDAGTALTVDAVSRPAGASESAGRPRFEGGAIAAGPRVLAASLGAAGARLFEVEPKPGAVFAGRTSAAALVAGIVHGLRGTTRELTSGLERELGLTGSGGAAQPAIVVTGGARRLLLEPPLWELGARPSPIVEPELVHRGLLAALLDAERA